MADNTINQGYVGPVTTIHLSSVAVTMSSKIDQIAAAMSALQGEMEPAKKGSTANYGTYASINDVLQASLPLLSKHGLSLMQWQFGDELGRNRLMNILTHKSGQYISAPALLDHEKIQKLGANNTYQRRYTSVGILGLPQADSDDIPTDEVPNMITPAQIATLKEKTKANPKVLESFLKQAKANDVSELYEEEYFKIMKMLS